jgi:hypothetical protein
MAGKWLGETLSIDAKIEQQAVDGQGAGYAQILDVGLSEHGQLVGNKGRRREPHPQARRGFIIAHINLAI